MTETGEVSGIQAKNPLPDEHISDWSVRTEKTVLL